MEFDDTVKTKYGEVRSVYTEEFEQQGDTIKKQLQFARMPVSKSKRGLWVVKDTELSGLAHNLLLDSDGGFIALKRPVTNILSMDWLDKIVDMDDLPANYSKSIWIPTDAGDFVLAQLNSKLEDTLRAHQFNIDQQSTVQKPMDANLNIICSHGDKDIARFHSLYQNHGQSLHASNGIIVKGDVLILLVCHSGSMQQDIFRNQFESLIKYYFELGFKVIIAPSWALHINIPPIWLPIFLDQINRGESVSKAVFEANKSVYEIYPTPGAWACMHLYGNGLLKIKA